MNEVPTLQEEVERKALEALEMVAIDRDTGKITEAQYSYALTVLWASCAGIAGSGFMTIMEVAGQGKKDGSQYTRRFMRSEKGDIAKITNFHDGVIRLELSLRDGLHKSEKDYDCTQELNPCGAAKEKFLNLIDNLVIKGFEEI